MRKWWQIALWPFGLLYGCIMAIRNFCFNKGLFKSVSFEFPVVVVGNLVVGGSGKSPMVMYLAEHVFNDYKIGVLSRGYGRKSKGFKWVNQEDDSRLVGDEPLMIKRFQSNLKVAVCEDRVLGIKTMLLEDDSLGCILLDDAFQHRRLRARLNILLCPYDQPLNKDWPMPAGRLREFSSGSKRADVVVITKCPRELNNSEQLIWRNALSMNDNQELFFAQYLNDKPKLVHGVEGKNAVDILVTGIASGSSLLYFLQNDLNIHIKKHFAFPDHHDFGEEEYLSISKEFPGKISIYITEKDWVKWRPYSTNFADWSIYVVPVTIKISEEELFKIKCLQVIKESN